MIAELTVSVNLNPTDVIACRTIQLRDPLILPPACSDPPS